MKIIISTEKIPIKFWLDDIEDGAFAQVLNLANLPFAFKHIAIMPDAHQGYGMPIGGVLATKWVIIPNAVGVDIGCGMCAVKTSLKEIDLDTLKKIMGEIRKAIPVGKNRHKEMQDESLMPEIIYNMDEETEFKTQFSICYKEYSNARKSLGTLGGGNHFIEIQKGNDGFIWIMIHSGSRNLGFTVANHYNKLAIELNKKWFSEVDIKQEFDPIINIAHNYAKLAFLPIDSEEGKSYLREMNYCLEFALANRKLMMDRIIDIFQKICTDKYGNNYCESFDPIINIAHNYAKMENHFGENVMIHRKGATLASDKTIGIIPGSQGTKSYIVKGKGNPDSFNSCSHGAGRKMSRTKAKETLDLDTEIDLLNNQGIIHSIRGVGQLDEAPSAYKDISKVMENQKDLVKILIELSPIAVIKG